MAGKINAVHFEHKNRYAASVACFSVACAEKAMKFHRSFPDYDITPLADLKNLAQKLGVSSVCVKDESKRFSLNAFKVLGCSFAIGQILAQKLGTTIDRLSYEILIRKDTRVKLGDITFVTATDGNHGRAVAYTAERLRQKSVVYMPAGSSLERLENIRVFGADAMITDLNYDDTVRLAKSAAEQNGWILTQDTAWEGYETIPTWIMQGYTTMAHEAMKQLAEVPTHVFLQAGVGSMAGAVTAYFAARYGEKRPIITIVEPDKADCIYRTAKANDGTLHTVTGKMDTIMSGLACGEPCTIGWNILRDHADHFISVPDSVAENGMRILAYPDGEDEKIISGESGAVTIGLLAEIAKNDELRSTLKLDANSRILCFSTEGDTDKKSYQKIISRGKYEF